MSKASQGSPSRRWEAGEDAGVHTQHQAWGQTVIWASRTQLGPAKAVELFAEQPMVLREDKVDTDKPTEEVSKLVQAATADVSEVASTLSVSNDAVITYKHVVIYCDATFAR